MSPAKTPMIFPLLTLLPAVRVMSLEANVGAVQSVFRAMTEALAMVIEVFMAVDIECNNVETGEED